MNHIYKNIEQCSTGLCFYCDWQLLYKYVVLSERMIVCAQIIL